MANDLHPALAELRDGRLYRFADWPNPAVPNGRIGVYTVWHDDQLVYVGMAGREKSAAAAAREAASGRLTGIRSRLASHASGRRSGDQFCIYVFDRLILPALSHEQIDSAAQGQLSLDGLTRQVIRQSLGYRFTLLQDAATARVVERQIQREGLAGQLPYLNPLRRSTPIPAGLPSAGRGAAGKRTRPGELDQHSAAQFLSGLENLFAESQVEIPGSSGSD
jgi:hypothetical protein